MNPGLHQIMYKKSLQHHIIPGSKEATQNIRNIILMNGNISNMFKYTNQYVNIDNNKLSGHFWMMLRSQCFKTDKGSVLSISW